MKVVDLAELSEVLSQLSLQSLNRPIPQGESSEVEVVLGHRPFESESLQSEEMLAELTLHVRRHVQIELFVLAFRVLL